MIRPFARPGAILLFCISLLTSAGAQSLKVTLLGTGYPAPRMDRFGPSMLVEAGDEKLLFDCGRGTTQRLEQLGVPLSDITAVFLTHLHFDHTIGLPDLWLTGWLRGRRLPLRVWGPSQTADFLSHIRKAFDFDVRMRRNLDEQLDGAGLEIQDKEIEQGLVYQSASSPKQNNDAVKVTAFLVDHGPVAPAFGYRVDYRGRSLVISGDTRPSENLVKFAEGADVLIHEVIDPARFRSAVARHYSAQQINKIIAHHTTPEQAGTVFARIKPKLAVYSHIVAAEPAELERKTRSNYSGPLQVGADLMQIEIAEQVKVRDLSK